LEALTNALANVKLAPNDQATDSSIDGHVLPNYAKARPKADYIPARIALACTMLTQHLQQSWSVYFAKVASLEGHPTCPSINLPMPFLTSLSEHPTFVGSVPQLEKLHEALAIAPWDSFNFPSLPFGAVTKAHIIEDTLMSLLPQGTAGYTFPTSFAFDVVITALASAAAQADPAHSKQLPAAIAEQEGMFGLGDHPECTPCTQLGCSGNLDPTDNACTSCGFFSVKKSKPNPPAGGNGVGASLNPFPPPYAGFDNLPSTYDLTGGLFNFPGTANAGPAGGASYPNGPGPVGGNRIPGAQAFGGSAARISKDDLQQRQAKAALIELAKNQGDIHTLRTNGVYSAVDWAQAQAIHGENASKRLASITDKDGTYNLNKIDAATLRSIYTGTDSKPFDVKGAAGASTAPIQGAGKALDGTIVALAGKLRLLALQHLPAIRKYILYE
jgi:hypothetical protein